MVNGPCRFDLHSQTSAISRLFSPQSAPLTLSDRWHHAGDPDAAEACAVQHRRVREEIFGRERGVLAQGGDQIPPECFIYSVTDHGLMIACCSRP